MTPELFADRISEITLTGSVVRIDLASFSASERDANNQPRLEMRQRVVMPTEGFVQSFGLMAKVMQDLQKRGLLRVPEGAAPPADAPTKPGGSPNFKTPS